MKNYTVLENNGGTSTHGSAVVASSVSSIGDVRREMTGTAICPGGAGTGIGSVFRTGEARKMQGRVWYACVLFGFHSCRQIRLGGTLAVSPSVWCSHALRFKYLFRSCTYDDNKRRVNQQSRRHISHAVEVQ